MRLPHHLLRTPHGIFYFQIRVPRHLQPTFGAKVIRKSLHTRDPVKARSYSYHWSLHYAAAFGKLEGEAMAPKVSDILKAAEQGELRRYDAVFDPATGNLASIKTDGTEADHLRAMKYTQEVMAHRVVPRLAPEPPAIPPAKPSKSVGAAFLEYAMTEAKELRPNTREQRERATSSFVAAIGQATPLRDVTRTMAGAWARDLMAGGMTKTTTSNLVSHVAQLFKTFKRWGDYDGENPVKGVVVTTKKEKRQRKLDGFKWEPFEIDQLHKIYQPANLGKKRGEHVPWAAMIGLYTGARVSEVAQLFVRDFSVKNGFPCVSIWNESDGQTSQKTAPSQRLVPLHPDLIELGLWDRVERLRRANELRLFPGMNIDSKAGPGNAISKGFSYLVRTQLGLNPRRQNGIIGFHSLRKNVTQALQGSPLLPERRRAFMGHEDGERDVHEEDYMREWTEEELSILFPYLKWRDWLDMEGLKKLLNPG